MKLIGNILWLIFTGLVTAFGYFIGGLVWCITIIGIPFGKQCFKFSRLTLLPFGSKIVKDKPHPVANVIWFIFGGFVMAIGYLFAGVIWCITILGIPFGVQCFKLAKLSVAPFGKKIVG